MCSHKIFEVLHASDSVSSYLLELCKIIISHYNIKRTAV